MRIKKQLVILLVLSMLTGSIPMAATAQEAGSLVDTVLMSDEVYVDAIPEGETGSFADYVQQQMYYDERIAAFYGSYGESVIPTDVGRQVYLELKEGIKKIAAQGGSTQVTITLEDVQGIDTYASTEEEANSKYSAGVRAYLTTHIDINLFLRCLLADCPYEFYWFDKTVNPPCRYGAQTQATMYQRGENEFWVDNITLYITFSFQVAADYQADGYDATSPVVTSDVSAVGKAIANAKAVVEANKNLTDREKLRAYKDYICGQVTYDKAAAGASGSYGNPWQLIYVFDEVTTTNVVCEGYAKAFQYLCELSSFYDDDFASYLVTGTMEGGNHMWNVVSLGGTNYFVDVTNEDTLEEAGLAGEPLFMLLNPNAGTAAGYTIEVDRVGSIEFVYDDFTNRLFSDSVRKLSNEATYAVILENVGNGSVTTTNKYVKANTQIDLDDTTAVSVQADRGYRFDRWEMSTAGLSLNDNAFVMPEGDVSIQAVFVAWLLGDLDAKDGVGESDVALLKAYLTGGYVPDDTYPMEFYKDGTISSRNLVRLKRFLNGDIDSLQVS